MISITFATDTPIRMLSHATLATKIGSHKWASPGLLNNYLICLRGVFKFATKDLKIDNPMDGIDNAKDQ